MGIETTILGIAQFCKAELFSALGHSAGSDVLPVNRPNCGPYELSDSADAVLHAHPAPRDRARLAYCIRRLPPSTLVTASLIEKVLKLQPWTSAWTM